MPLIMPDFVLQKTIKEALTTIANSESTISFLFGQFTESHLSDIYGQKEIDSVIEFLTKDKIKTVTSFNMVDANSPCYSIQLLNNQEIDNEAVLDDFGEEVFLDEDGDAVQKYPSSLTYPEVIPAHDSKVDQSFSAIQESLLIGCHAPDHPNMARYMAWLLQYIIRSNKNTLIERGLNRISIGFSDFNRANEYLPDNIFTRFGTFNCVHYLSFNETDLELTATNVTVQGQIREYTDNDGNIISPATTEKSLPATATFVTIDD